MHKKKSELIRLKIMKNKLFNENVSNKNLISKILSIPLEKELTREQVLQKLENCNLSQTDRKMLQEAYDIILLRSEISDRKMQINDQNNYIENLKQNSKTKVINELESDYYSKCEKQRAFLRKIKKLEDIKDLTEKQMEKINENIEQLKKNSIELMKNQDEYSDKYEKILEEKNNLIKQNKQLEDKIKKQLKANRQKYNENYENSKRIKDLEANLKEIKDYKEGREQFLKYLDSKKTTL